MAARRTEIDVSFDGVNISDSIWDNLISLSYKDYEEDEADDLQIELEDRGDVWLSSWLENMIQAAAAISVSGLSSQQTEKYKTTASGGLNVRSGPGTNQKKLGALAYGTQLDVLEVKNNWARINYNGKTAYVSMDYLTKANTVTAASGGNWKVGDVVTVNGRPQYTSYGTGTPGKAVTNYQGSITYLNLKSGVPYPIHVGRLGWFAVSQVAGGGTQGERPVTQKTKGFKIQASIKRLNWDSDGKNKTLDCGQFELDALDVGGPPSSITIKATALPYNSQIRQTKKSKAWESYSLSRIAREIAQTNGMGAMYESSHDPFFERVEQTTISDIAFLSRLCKDAGLSLKVTNNIIVLFDDNKYKTMKSIKTITRGKSDYIKYRLRTGDADRKYGSCRVSYVLPSGKLIEATAYAEEENEQVLEISAKVNSIGEAQTLAQKQLRLKNKYQKTANFTLMGDPELVSGQVISLRGWGAWDGKYVISESEHSVGSSGYITQIGMRLIKPILLGDIDGDGVITAADAELALRASAGLIKLEDWQIEAADIDGDGKVTAADAREISRMAADA